MHSAGLAEAAASSSGAGAAASGACSSPPSVTTSHSPHRQQQRDDSYYHQGHGGEGGGSPGWKQGAYRGVEGDWGWPHQQVFEDEDDALLVRWSEGLDFDRQALSLSAPAAVVLLLRYVLNSLWRGEHWNRQTLAGRTF